MYSILLQPGDQALMTGIPSWIGDTTPPAVTTGPCIELISVSQGLKQQITTDVSNAARTAGRPIVTELTCEKYVDPLSIKLYDHCLRAVPLGVGANQPTTIYLTQSSGDRTTPFLTLALRDALVSEIQFQTPPNDMPTEQFKLNFTEILWTYFIQGAQGEQTRISGGWSLAKNRPIAAFST